MRGADLLAWHYAHPLANAERADCAVGVTSNTVPWEILEATGATPFVFHPPPAPTPFADRWMEPVFEPRIRRIFDGVATGKWPFVSRLIVSRASEQEHKLFLYLREVSRQGISEFVPPITLFNLLQTDTEEARQYGLARLRELASCESAPLATAIRRGNLAREALARLMGLRAEGQVRGVDALRWIGAYYFMNRGAYAEHLELAVDTLRHTTPHPGPRILIQGGPFDHPQLHTAIESAGAIVVAESDWWGTRALTPPISLEGDLVANVFASYYRAAGPRRTGIGWLEEQLSRIDGIVFYLPPDDDVLGWDYPAMRTVAKARAVPQLLIRHDARDAARDAYSELTAFIASLGTRNGR